MNEIADAHTQAGRHGESLKLRIEMLEQKSAKLGRDHSDTFVRMNNLATCYFHVHRLVDAATARRDAGAAPRQSGPNHSDTLASMNALAISYSAENRHEDARKLIEQALAIRLQANRQADEDIAGIAWTQTVLGIIGQSAHNLASAERAYNAACAKLRKAEDRRKASRSVSHQPIQPRQALARICANADRASADLDFALSLPATFVPKC